MRTLRYRILICTAPILALILFLISSTATGAVLDDENRADVLKKVRSLQAPFIENTGQIADESVRFYAKTFGGTVFITKDGRIVYSLPKFDEENGNTGWTIEESFMGAAISEVTGEERAVTKVSYFRGNNPSKWKNTIREVI